MAKLICRVRNAHRSVFVGCAEEHLGVLQQQPRWLFYKQENGAISE